LYHSITKVYKIKIKLGSFAERISAPWNSVYMLPEFTSLETGASIILTGLTALTFVTESYEVK
jgi:NADPH:quinone reductase